MSANVEAVLRAALLDALGVPVHTQVPTDRPAEFVRLVAAGGPEMADEVVDWADVTWEAWGATQMSASILALRLRDVLPTLASDAVAGEFIADAKSTRPRWFPDETSRSPRYVGTARVLFHAV